MRKCTDVSSFPGSFGWFDSQTSHASFVELRFNGTEAGWLPAIVAD